MTIALSALVSAWLAGTLGGVHCLAMCGGFAAAFAARDASANRVVPLLPAHAIARQQAVYHAGRVITYGLLGAICGASGDAALRAADVVALQTPLYVLANLALLAVAMRLVWTRDGQGWLARIAAKPMLALAPLIGRLMQRNRIKGRFALGLAWGLVPCALVYSVLPVAMFAGGAWQGAAVMLAFGLGTLPTFAAGSLLVARGRAWLRGATARTAAAFLIGAFALAGIYRGVVLHDLASGPFCLVVH